MNLEIFKKSADSLVRWIGEPRQKKQLTNELIEIFRRGDAFQVVSRCLVLTKDEYPLVNRGWVTRLAMDGMMQLKRDGFSREIILERLYELPGGLQIRSYRMMKIVEEEFKAGRGNWKFYIEEKDKSIEEALGI